MSKKTAQTEQQNVDFSSLNLARLGHNFLMGANNGDYSVEELNKINQYLQFIFTPQNRDLKSYKVGVMLVCINPVYWPYMAPVINDLKTFFLPGHEVELMVWTDVPEKQDLTAFLANYPTNAQIEELKKKNIPIGNGVVTQEQIYAMTNEIRSLQGVTLFPVDTVGWPYPTLMRYNIFLNDKEYLQKFDYLFYIDLDMRVVNVVGDEILGTGLTAAQHPMYALSKNLWYPFEPDPDSTAFVKQAGRYLIKPDGSPMFEPLYAAGGFQGGPKDLFIKAMETMRDNINKDFTKNYIARWNDESHWNRYLYDNPPSIVLPPSYVYPDSMIEVYYEKIWGRNYKPKIITLTKPFTVTKEGGDAAKDMVSRM